MTIFASGLKLNLNLTLSPGDPRLHDLMPLLKTIAGALHWIKRNFRARWLLRIVLLDNPKAIRPQMQLQNQYTRHDSHMYVGGLAIGCWTTTVCKYTREITDSVGPPCFIHMFISKNISCSVEIKWCLQTPYKMFGINVMCI